MITIVSPLTNCWQRSDNWTSRRVVDWKRSWNVTDTLWWNCTCVWKPECQGTGVVWSCICVNTPIYYCYSAGLLHSLGLLLLLTSAGCLPSSCLGSLPRKNRFLGIQPYCGFSNTLLFLLLHSWKCCYVAGVPCLMNCRQLNNDGILMEL